MQTLRCARCGSDVQATASYCSKCGAPADLLTTIDSDSPTVDAPTPSHRLLDTPALDQGRFVPGEILAERYRIIALLGKGGMGEVYRADDLRLSQAVAMKFLPAALSQDGVALARFHREVRLARQVSHTNVCRVFDIGESGGQPFLTMEYVDGEDLGSLLKRIGRLPHDKAIDISRQLCAGLAAAHEAGVLHRDLKPANVMLDKRGKVRITDFGLAGLSAAAGDEIYSGTAAYMAPEQLAGQASTTHSDIYALGLVLYEIFTGKRVFEAASIAELIRQHESTTPTSPSQLVEGMDPLVERVILRCLENEPLRRPRSALQVAAALPGGDPLAAALAAGETPSPEMVAAAGGEGALEPKVAWSLLAAALFILAAIIALAHYSTDLGSTPAGKSPGTLQVKAEETVEKAGYSDAPDDRASWFDRNYDFVLYPSQHVATPVARKNLARAGQGALTFFYRQSPVAMAPGDMNLRVGFSDPAYEVSGMVTVVLDVSGRLVGFLAVPPQLEPAAIATSEPNWSQMIADSGIDVASLKPVDPTWLPAVPFDRRYGWRGFYPEDPKTEIQVVAASHRGKPVYFQVIGPWTRPWRMTARQHTRSFVVRATSFVIGAFIFLVLAAVFARRNLRLGRGDRRGAFRLSAFVFCSVMAFRLLSAHHVPDVGAEFLVFVRAVSQALFSAASLWLLYMALEPFVRRQWPELLISWTRLLSGRFRDPLLGRDLLAGTLCGCLVGLAVHVTNALPAWFNFPGQTPIWASDLTLGSPQELLAYLFGNVPGAMFLAFVATFCLYLTKTLLRRYWLSVAATSLVLLLVSLPGENFALEAPAAILTTAATMFVLLRFGMFAAAVLEFSYGLVISSPITLDLAKWYAPHSLFALGVLLAMLVYGLRLATGNKPLLAE